MPDSIKFDIALSSGGFPKSRLTIRLRPPENQDRCIFYEPSKTIVVANSQGNFADFVRMLMKCKIIDSNFKWIFDNGHLVVMGSNFDPGQSQFECLWLIYALEAKAAKIGGYVHYLPGHRDLQYLHGKWRFEQPPYADLSEQSKRSNIALYDGNNEIWRWITSRNTIEKIGRTLFLDLEVYLACLPSNPYLKNLNKTAREIMTKRPTRLLPEVTWSQTMVNELLATYDADQIITAARLPDKTQKLFDGKLISVNSFIDARQPNVLVIKNGQIGRVKAAQNTSASSSS
jgi:hypothetical protein